MRDIMNSGSIRLGVMPPLTGLVEIYGQEISLAAQIACQEVNESGGVLGKPLELIIEDDGSLPEGAVSAAKKLVDQHRCVAIIGNLLSNSRISVAYRVAEPRKIPYLNFSFYEGSISSRYFFHFAALPNQQIDKMIPCMLKMYGPKMFFAGNNYEWPRGSIDAAKRILEISQGQVVGEEYCPIGIELDDIESLLDNVAASGADVFVPYFAGTDQVNLLSAFTARGLKKRMSVVMGHYDEVMASHLPPEVREGLYSSNTYFMNVDTLENRRYLKRLETMPGITGIWPQGNGILTNFGEGTYLCVKAFALAANKAGSVEPEALIHALETICVTGPQGTVQMDPATHHAKVNTFLSCCRADGTFKLIENFGTIDPLIPERYSHLQVVGHTNLDEDVRIQARMLSQMTDAVFLIDAKDGVIIYANSYAERMFGYSKGELMGEKVSTLHAPSDKTSEEITADISRILYCHGVWRGEIRTIKKDGTIFWGASSFSPFTHPKYGEILMSVYKDITEHKRDEEALAESRATLKQILNTVPQSIFWKDMDGAYLGCNLTFAMSAGLNSPEQIKGKTDFDLPWPKDEAEAYRAGDREVAQGKKIKRHIVEPLQLPDGKRLWIDTTKVPLLDKDDNVIGVLGTFEDITERKQAEEKLQKSEERHRTILQTAMDGFWMVDLHGRILEVNEAYCRMSGYSARELLAMNISDLESVESAMDTAAHINKVMTQGEDRFESRHRCKDGRIIDVEINCQYREEEGGQLVVFLQDITERKQNEEELRQSEITFRKLFEDSSDAILLIDGKGVFVECNQAALDLLKMTREQFILLSPARISPEFQPDGRRSAEAAPEMIALAYNKGVHRFDWTCVNSEGGEFIVEVSFMPITIKGQIMLHTSWRDITDRKRAEASIIKEREKIQLYMDTAGVMMVALDTRGLIAMINMKGCAILGYEEQELLGRNWFEVCLPTTRLDEFMGVFQALMRGEHAPAEYYENPVLTKNGDERQIAFHSALLYDQCGSISGILFSGEDVTERKQAEKEREQLLVRLNQAQKMESIGVLAGGIAHDFNNILSAILGYTELARDDSPPGSSVADDLDKVLTAAYRAKDLVKQILAFSRQATDDKIPIQIQPLIKDSLKMLRASIPSTISITEDIHPHCGTVLGDPTQIHQMIMNLCTNAYHAMETTGGELAVKVHATVIASSAASAARPIPPGEYVEVEVSDTGTGIEPDIIDKIFDPYFTTKEIGKGTGMGLSITHGIIKSYGGAITVDSTLGQGTTFQVYFPVVHEEAKEFEEAIEAPRGQGRILFVDDEELLMQMGHDLLERLGYTVTTRRSSFEALETFMNDPHQFDLVITDQTMPGMTGIDLARRMLQIRPDVPIILCTGYSNLVNEESAKAIGIREFVFKPLTKSSIGHLVEKIFKG